MNTNAPLSTDSAFVPADLQAVPQWVGWWSVQGEGKPIRLPNGSMTRKPLEKRDKPYKLPINPHCGSLASSTRAGTWATYGDTLRAVQRYSITGAGFVFADSDPFAGIDLDNCRDPETGEIAPWAQEIIRQLNSYTEISPSQTGVKVWVRGQLPPEARNRTKYESGEVEMYSRGRYFTVTGHHLEGTPKTIEDRQSELTDLHSRLFLDRNTEAEIAKRPEALTTLGDQELIERAKQAKNGAKFSRLWAGDTSDYAADDSRADMALCCELAFWTGRDESRIDQLFRQSGLYRDKWERRDYRERTIQAACDETREVWQPNNRPTSDASKKPEQDHRERVSQATQLVQLVADIECFRTPEGKPFATFTMNGHEETHPVRSKMFRTYLQRRYYQEKKHAVSSKALQDALGVIDGDSVFGPNEHNVFTRIGEHDGSIYLDLGTKTWEAIEITQEGWRSHPKPPIRFRRARGILPISRPVRDPAAASEFQKLVNIRSDSHDMRLIQAWLVAAMRPTGPFPVLTLNSEQGSGKTTLSKVLRSLTDPNQAPVRSQPRDERDLMIAASNSWIIGLDNISKIPDWLSDAICRLSTGGGFATRELHTDEDEILFNVQRPVILNGIEEICTRGDLLDRAILVQLPEIPENRRLPEKEFWGRFNHHRAGILAHLLDAISAALLNIDDVKLPSLPRMADFAQWATAAEPGLGWEDGEFLAAYNANRGEANEVTLDASPVARRIIDLVDARGDWSGTSTELLKALTERTGEPERRLRSWPQSPRGLSGILKRLLPNFRRAGVTVEFSRASGGNRERRILLRRTPESGHIRDECGTQITDSGRNLDSYSSLPNPLM